MLHLNLYSTAHCYIQIFNYLFHGVLYLNLYSTQCVDDDDDEDSTVSPILTIE